MTAAGDDDGNDVDAPFSIGSVVLADVVYQMTVLAAEVVSTIGRSPRSHGRAALN